MNTRYKELEITIKKKLNGNFMGSFNSAFKWLWIEFESLRDYVPGDSIKNIDWKTTAKLWTVHVKNYEEEKDLNVLFYIQLTESLDFWGSHITKKETLEKIFFLLAQCSLGHWLSIGAYITLPQSWSVFINFSKWEETIIKILDIVANDNSKYITSTAINIKNLHFKNNLIFILTDNSSPEKKELTYINASNEIVYINIFDHFDNNLIDTWAEVNLQIESYNLKSIFNNFLWLHDSQKEKIQQYKLLRKAMIETIKKSLWSKNIHYLNIDDHDDIFLVFYKFFMHYKH